MSRVTASLDGAVSEAIIRRSRAKQTLHFLPLWFLAATVVITYAAIAWTLRRGFDWTDEAFVYTMIASNRLAVGEAWGFQHLLHPLYSLTGESVLVFRVLRLLGYALLSVVLVGCARAVVRRTNVTIPGSGWVFVLLMAQVGTFLSWSYPPRYIGYNELGSWLAQLGVALIVVSLAVGASARHDQRASWMLWRVWTGLGAVTALLVFAKVTSAVAFAMILALALVIPNPSLRLWKRLVSVCTGAGAVLVVLWVSGCPTGFYLKNAYSLFFDKSVRDAFGHPLAPMMTIYKDSLFVTVRAVLPALVIFALLVATFRLKARPRAGNAGGVLDWIRWALGALLLLALVALPKLNALIAPARLELWSYLGELVVFIGAAGIIGVLILGANGWTLRTSTVSRSLQIGFGGAAIVAAPLVSAIGTSNPIMGQLMWAGSLWAVVMGIGLVLLTQRAALLRSSASGLPSLIGCVVMIMVALAVMAHIAAPYRTAPLLSQETSTSVPELRGLLLTRADAAWIDWVAAAGDSLGADGVPAIAIATRVGGVFTSTGALFAFNHSGYANPWLGIDWPAAFNALRSECTQNPPTDLFVLQPGSSTPHAPSTVGVTKTLAACGIKFPGDFLVVDQRDSADPALALTVWRLKGDGLVRQASRPAR
ncbi:MAG: hypothetical protein ABI720_12660 [Actinomycetes bacterium]